MDNQTTNYLEPQGYAHNEVGGYGMAGTRHEGESQDAFWPSKGEELPRPEVVEQLGELYLLSDGVTKCADGYMASQLAVQTVRKHYYGQPLSNDRTPAMRLKRLQEAVWQAHLQLARWDKKFYCWQTEKHPDGEATTYTRQELAKWGKLKDGVARCPLCNEKMDGLAATLLAAVIHKRHLFLVAVGDSFAWRIPADSMQPIHLLHKIEKKQFLGSPLLRYRHARHLPYWETELKAGDLVLLCSDGVIETLKGWKGHNEWGAYLRQQLTAQNIRQAGPTLINTLDQYRTNLRDERFNDDLTLLAIAMAGQPASAQPLPKISDEQKRGQPKETTGDDITDVVNPFVPSSEDISTRPSDSQVADSDPAPIAVNYAGEAVGGYGLAGSRHAGAAQDAFWPSPAAGFSPERLSRFDMLLSGRLYLLADGVTLCADGHEASRLAAQTVGSAYYAHSAHAQDTFHERNQRLVKALWQAHQTVAGWDEKFFCWRKQVHPPQHFKKQKATWRRGHPHCPLCDNPMAGLQTTLVAAVLRGYKATLVAVGESTALRLPANPNEPLEFLYQWKQKEKNFLGMPGLSDQHVYQAKVTLKPGDQLLLCGDGVIETLEGRQKVTGQDWHVYLRRRLKTADLHQEVCKLIEELHTFRRHEAPHLDDDLTLLAVTIPDESKLTTLREKLKQHGDKLNTLWEASNGKLEPRAYNGFLNALEELLLYKDDPTLWNQYGAAWRERALARLRKVGTLNDDEALAWISKAVQLGDAEAPHWQEAMKRAEQIVAWRDNQKELLQASARAHEQVIKTLQAMKLVETLPEVVQTLQSSLRRIARTLRKANRPKIAAYYQDLLKQWNATISARRSNNSPSSAQKPPAHTGRLFSLVSTKPKMNQSKELEWVREMYQEIITELEQRNLYGAIAAADQRLLYQWLRDPSPDAIRQALTLLRDYQEAPKGTTAAHKSLAYQEFSELLKNKFQLKIPEFNPKHPPTADTLIDYLVGLLKGRAPQFHEEALVADYNLATSTEPIKEQQNGRDDDDEQKDQPDLQTATAQKLREQGKIIEAACVAVKMPMPESLGSHEREKVTERQRAFVNEAWELAYGMASGKLMLIGQPRLQSAIDTLNKAELDQIPGYYAVRMCAVHDLLLVLYYEQGRAPASATLVCEQFTQYTQLTPQDYEQLQGIRLARIDQVWGMAFQKAKFPRSIRREERGKLEGIVEKLSEAQESQLIAAGLLLEAALAFQADKRGEAAEQVVEAWDILENPNKDQVWQLADQKYLHSWDKVHFWQSGRRRQLERLRQLADDPRLSSVRVALITRFDRRMAPVRNKWLSILSVLAVVLTLTALVATTWGTGSTNTGQSSGSPTPATMAVVSPSPTNDEIAVQTVDTSGRGLTTPTTVRTNSTPVPTASSTPSPTAAPSSWTPQAGPLLGVKPVQVEMKLSQAGVNTPSDLVTYFGQKGDQVADELAAIDTLTPDYPGDTVITPDTPLWGMLPADPLFLFVGQMAETPRMHSGHFGFWLTNSSGSAPRVFVRVLEEDQSQIENQPLDDGGWVWVLGSSKQLEKALLACRDSLAENHRNGENRYNCQDQQSFMTGPRPINLDAVLLIGIENGVLQEPLLENAIENRWIYGDLGPDGLQLALPDNAIPEPTSRPGIVQGSWHSASNTITPSDMLARQDDGVYRRIEP